jgi:hypothetical protein
MTGGDSAVAAGVMRRLLPSGTIIVPMPSLVKTSSSSECGCRPSMTCACGTPPSTARMHASSLGIIPESTVVSSSVGASVTESRLSRLSTVGPVGVHALDVGEDDELAGVRRATARAAAAVSALTLRT